jgi:predicted RNA polymerase sigma factor
MQVVRTPNNELTANYTGTMTDTLTHDARETLYITDAELIRRMGVPEKIARDAIRALDHNPKSGFPKKDRLWGDRRYWPAVKAYLDRLNGLNMEPQRRIKNG